MTVGALVLLGGLAALSTGWASDDGAAFEEVNRTLFYAGAILLVGLAARRRDLPAWLAGLAIGGTAVALVALASRLGGFGGDRELALALPLAAARFSYPLGYWNGLGYLMAMTLPILLFLAGTASTRFRGLAVGASVPVIAVLFLTSSRGGLIAAAIGIACVAWQGPVRSRLLLIAVVALPAWLVAIEAVALRRSHLEPPADPGLWGIGLGIGIALVAILAGLLYRRLDRVSVPAWVSRPGPVRKAVLGILLLGVLAALGSSAFLGSFRGEAPSGGESAASSAASDSQRAEFWGTALDALRDDPLRGTGAGGYPFYWNAHGSLPLPVENAHSAPIEELAELGLPGGALFLVALLTPLVALIRRLRHLTDVRAPAGTVLGVILAGTLAITVDWTWDLPAAGVPLAVCLGVAVSGALQADQPVGVSLVDASFTGFEPGPGPARPGPALLGFGVAALTLIAAGAAAILALASIQLGVSADRLAAGDLDGAAKAARAAGTIEPWSPEPDLRLASIEMAGNNFGSAQREAAVAARASPADFRPWLVLSDSALSLGALVASAQYMVHANSLAPLVLQRADEQ